MRAYATQVETLRRLRNGGSQTVRVEHVHVNEGRPSAHWECEEEGQRRGKRKMTATTCAVPLLVRTTLIVTPDYSASGMNRLGDQLGVLPSSPRRRDVSARRSDFRSPRVKKLHHWHRLLR